jgi:hypothetical protein
MEEAACAPFERGRAYTRVEIHAVLGGSRRAALPTKAGRVVCACLTRERNPRAPEEIVIGGNERSARLARELAASGAAVPVFVRQSRGEWGYEGERRVRAVVDEPGALLALVAEGAPADATLALLLEESPGQAHSDMAQTAPSAAVPGESVPASGPPVSPSPAGK